jgi:hypothetical protein
MFAAPSLRGDQCKRSATLRINELQDFAGWLCAALVRAHSYRSPKLVRASRRRRIDFPGACAQQAVMQRNTATAPPTDAMSGSVANSYRR